MNDEEITEKLAELMGWKEGLDNNNIDVWRDSNGDTLMDTYEWQPLKDWSHLMMCVEKKGFWGELSYALGTIMHTDIDSKRAIAEALIETMDDIK